MIMGGSVVVDGSVMVVGRVVIDGIVLMGDSVSVNCRQRGKGWQYVNG